MSRHYLSFLTHGSLCLACFSQTMAQASDPVIDLEQYEVIANLASYVESATPVGTKTSTDLREIPLSIQVINQAFLDDLRAKNIEDAYPFITGLTQTGRNANSFALRGFNANLQSVQVNGLPGLASRFGSPSTANVERIEVLRGATSLLYGQITPAGLVNIVTKRPQAQASYELFTAVSSFAGRTGTIGDHLGFSLTADATGPLTENGKWLYRLILSHENIDSFRDGVNFENFHLIPSLTYRWNEEASLTLEIEYTKENGVADDGVPAPFNSLENAPPITARYQEANDIDNDEGITFGLVYNQRVNDVLTTSLTARSVFHEDNRILFESNRLNNATPVEDSTLRRRFRNQLNKREYHFLDWNFLAEFGETLRHRVLLGVNGGYELRDFERISLGPLVGNIRIFDPVYGQIRPDPVPGSDRQTELYNYGLYLQDQLSLGEQWKAVLGLRYDAQDVDFIELGSGATNSQSTDAAVPMAGLLYHFNPAWTLYGSYSESFNPASVEREDLNGNTGFDAESGRQYEVGLKFTTADNLLSASLALYQIRLENVLEQLGVTNPNGNQAWELLGAVESEGLEFDLTWQPVTHWQLKAGYAYTDAKVAETTNVNQLGARPANISENSFHLWTRYNVPRGALMGLGFGLGIIYEDDRPIVSTNVAADQIQLPGYTRLDLGLYYTTERYSLNFNIKNLTDELYYTDGSNNARINPGNPREYILSVRANF